MLHFQQPKTAVVVRLVTCCLLIAGCSGLGVRTRKIARRGQKDSGHKYSMPNQFCLQLKVSQSIKALSLETDTFYSRLLNRARHHHPGGVPCSGVKDKSRCAWILYRVCQSCTGGTHKNMFCLLFFLATSEEETREMDEFFGEGCMLGDRA